MTSWRELITNAMSGDDSWAEVVALTLSQVELDAKFNNNYGSPVREPFVLWTRRYVYFSVDEDGKKSVARVDRFYNTYPGTVYAGPADEETK
jgi:hypothetical protein